MRYTYDVRFPGTDTPAATAPSTLRGMPDATLSAVPGLRVSPVAEDRTESVRALGGEDTNCGIPASNRVPVSENSLVRAPLRTGVGRGSNARWCGRRAEPSRSATGGRPFRL